MCLIGNNSYISQLSAVKITAKYILGSYDNVIKVVSFHIKYVYMHISNLINPQFLQ